MKVDILIIGAGIAGLNLARLIPKEYSVAIISKGEPWDCNSFYAQGGIATAKNSQDIPSHIQDTVNAGCGMGDIEAITKLSKYSIEAIKDLIDSGLKFDRKDGHLAYTKEAAHSTNRILHADGDATGRVIHKFLLSKSHHKIYTNSTVIDLFIKDNLCYGAKAIINGTLKKVYASYTILASGGVGNIYANNTNAKSISADIQGICIEKGIKLKDMEMLQFHPTVLLKDDGTRMLLSEALRGEGAWIIDEQNRRFLFDYHKDGELAPRDVVSRAIFDYTNKSGSKVYLSFENFPVGFFQNRFPNIYKNLLSLGFELPLQKVPIAPAFHYAMGGVEVDLTSKVKGFENLYAIGEVACTGVHGANRLASNSLLEGVVFSKIAANDILANFKDLEFIKFPKREYNLNSHKSKNQEIRKELAKIMWSRVGIVRDDNELQDALNRVNSFLKLNLDRLLHLRVLVAQSIIESAIKQKRSIGAHFKKEN
jgi:L-aspartate oxidase